MEPGEGNRPQLRLDELLSELQGRLQAVLSARDQMQGLLRAVVAIGSGLDLESTLRRIVETAVGLVDATDGALGVNEEDISYPVGRPPAGSFLEMPVRIRDEVFGNLYLTSKRGGGEFTEDDEAVLAALGAAAGVAIENARLYEAARRQQRQIQASVDVTTRLLSGEGPGEVLADVTRVVLDLSGADLAVLAVPDEDGRRLTIAYAEGEGADATRGLVLPAGQSLSGLVLSGAEPMKTEDFAVDERASRAARTAMSHIGPALVFPLGVPGNVHGVLTVGRKHGAAQFPPAQADVVASFATQAGVALELAARRADAERLSLFEDRDRIARDLHDLVIQRLYATGMALEGTMPMITRSEARNRISNAVDAMDDTIKDIRATIFALQTRDNAESQPDLRGSIVALVEEMTPLLGFAPSLRLGAGLRADVAGEPAEQALAALREALSNAARHAAASEVDVVVDIGPDGALYVQVADDGIGLPDPGSGGRRSGLRNLAQRADKLGGELRLEAAREGAERRGTRLEWRVPLG
jgi:signal transduction histidine kinase